MPGHDIMDEYKLKYMTMKELRKTVSAMRKKGCPAVSKLSKEGLLEEMAAYSAGNKARAKAKPVEMKDRPAKGKVEEKPKAPVKAATAREKAAEMMMYANPMVAAMAAKKPAAVKKIESAPAVVAAVKEGKKAKAVAEAKKVAKKEGVPAAVAKEVVEHIEDEVDTAGINFHGNDKFRDMTVREAYIQQQKNKKAKKSDAALDEFLLYHITESPALKKSTEELKEELEDLELQILDYEEAPEPAFKRIYDKNVETVALYKKILEGRGVKPSAAKAATAAPKAAETKTAGKRKASAYAMAVGKYMKQGMKMAEAAAAAKKELGK
jgi:hypothetical protein